MQLHANVCHNFFQIRNGIVYLVCLLHELLTNCRIHRIHKAWSEHGVEAG